VIEDQLTSLEEDVQTVRSHPLIPDTVKVGGFLYDVDTGLLSREI
jgi:carbonic anhydrase